MRTPLRVTGLAKSFTMHLRNGLVIPVLRDLDFSLSSGRCTVLLGPSGVGKSSILKMIYGNYRVEEGQILVRHGKHRIDIAKADPRTILNVRRDTIGYVSQFLRAVPRVAALDVAAEPLVDRGVDRQRACTIAGDLFARLKLPEQLWQLPPATFSGGEQQRVNIARAFITDHPILLLDEPTASLDAENRSIVIDMIREKKKAGTALLGIFHDQDVRQALADDSIDITLYTALGSPGMHQRQPTADPHAL